MLRKGWWFEQPNQDDNACLLKSCDTVKKNWPFHEGIISRFLQRLYCLFRASPKDGETTERCCNAFSEWITAVVMDGWMNQAYSRLSTTHGHITDCKLVCMYWTHLVLVRPAASLLDHSRLIECWTSKYNRTCRTTLQKIRHSNFEKSKGSP